MNNIFLFTLPTDNVAKEGLAGILAYLSGELPLLFPLLLFSLFILIVFVGYNIQARKSFSGNGDIIMWLALSSFITTIGASILFLIPNVINITTFTICMLLTIIFFIGYYIAKLD